MNTTKSLALAASVAALLATMGCSADESQETTVAKKEALVKCEGVNECKGTSECKGSDGKSACQGLNECKGQGWVTIPSEECTKKGGKVLSESEANAAAPAAETPAAPTKPDDEPPMTASATKCEGINECKGTSECKGADHACKGQNDCKGHGWIEVPSETDCTSKGGKVIA